MDVTYGNCGDQIAVHKRRARWRQMATADYGGLRGGAKGPRHASDLMDLVRIVTR